MMEVNQDALFMEPSDLDEAIVGYLERCGQSTVLCYDYEKLVQAFMTLHRTDREEAMEWIAYNCDAWMGENTPAILHTSSSLGL